MSDLAHAWMSSRSGKSFLSNLRHELRTPLNAIINYSEMILEDATAEVTAPLQQIRDRGYRLLKSIGALGDPAKVTGDSFHSQIEDLCREMEAPLDDVLTQSANLITSADELGIAGFVDDLQKIRAAGIRLSEELGRLLDRTNIGEEFAHAVALPTPAVPIASKAPSDLEATVSRVASIPGRLLVVDDNEINRDVLRRRLQSQGHQIALAASGAEALTLARAQPFDLILLDILMPEMSGLEVLQRLKGDAQLKHLPVIMISALDEMDSIIQSIEMGAEDYLPKPFEPAILRARVGACLEKKRLRDREVEYLEQIEAERNRADGLLHVILPAEVVKELKATNQVMPRRYENVAIMFTDIVSFTPYCDKHQPEEIVDNLQQMVVAFEELSVLHHLQKIKTIGDSFMAACGLLQTIENPVLECVRCGLKMIEAARRLPAAWEIRIGIHCGPVVAGVLGRHQYQFDLWSDTVNTAARMESHGIPGAVTLSEAAYQAVAQAYRCELLEAASIKGKGELKRYIVREVLS